MSTRETIPASTSSPSFSTRAPSEPTPISDRLQREIDQSTRNAKVMGKFMGKLIASFERKGA